EAGREATVVVGREVREALDLPGEEAAPERAVGDEADPERAARGEDLLLRVAAPERVLGLERGDGVHRARAPERLGPRRRAAEPAAARAPDQLLVGVGAVHVGRVEEVDAQVERAVDGRDRLAVVVRAVELRHAHAAEADGGDGGAEASELPSWNGHERTIDCG